MTQEYKHFAFISFNARDMKWGKALQRKLESYRLPATLCNEHGLGRKPLRPIFFAPLDIQPGGLSRELQDRLRASRNLIVICSPHSARSEWVGREIAFFHSLGRTEQIHFFIVDGVPHSGDPATECFHPVVETLGLPEILGANIHEKVYLWPRLNRERAFVQLISKLLGVEYDSLWQRHKRRLFGRIAAWCAGIVLVALALVGVWRYNRPVDATVRLREASVANAQLPPLRDAVVTLYLDNEVKSDTLRCLEEGLVFSNIPRRYLGQRVRITVLCDDCFPADTLLTLERSTCIDLYRRPEVYGDVHFRLWNPATEEGAAFVTVTLDGMAALSDEDGRVRLSVPLERQRPVYALSASVPLLRDSLRMPCSEDEIILIAE